MGDQNTIWAAGGVGTAFSVLTLVFVRFVMPLCNAANHRRVRSVCCGHVCVSSLDVEDTTPTVRTGVGESGVGAGAPRITPLLTSSTVG